MGCTYSAYTYLILSKCGVLYVYLLQAFQSLLSDKRNSAPHFLFYNYQP